MPAERDRQRGAALDVEADVTGDPGELRVLGLLGQDRQGPDQREPGVDHRRELAGEHGEALELHLPAEPGDLHVARSDVPVFASIAMGV